MLNSAEIYRVLEGFKHQLERVLAASRGSGSEAGSDLMEQGKLLQQQFQAEILPLLASGSALPPSALPALTELNRHMRLLTVELSFWRAAQQPETAQQKLAQIQQRLGQIQGFIDVLRNG